MPKDNTGFTVELKKFLSSKKIINENGKPLKEMHQWIVKSWNSLTKRVKNTFSELSMKETLEILESIITLDSARKKDEQYCKSKHFHVHNHRHYYRHQYHHYRRRKNHRRKSNKSRLLQRQFISSCKRRKIICAHCRNNTCCSNFRIYLKKNLHPAIKEVPNCLRERSPRRHEKSFNCGKHEEQRRLESFNKPEPQGLSANQCCAKRRESPPTLAATDVNWIRSVCLGGVWRRVSVSDIKRSADERRDTPRRRSRENDKVFERSRRTVALG